MTQPAEIIVPRCICRDPKCLIPFGICHCGCGGKTRISDATNPKRFIVAGQPVRFINGHGNLLPLLPLEDAAPFKIDGVYCRLIPLSKGFYAIVDAADYEWLMQWRWYALPGKSSWYATRHDAKPGKPNNMITMHRQIVAPLGDLHVDHISRVGLDNRRKNIRAATRTQNNGNTVTPNTNTSGWKGVYLGSSKRNPYVAQIVINGKAKYLGARRTGEEAHALYKAAAELYFGEFARASGK